MSHKRTHPSLAPHGFTLIELLIVLGAIGVLSSVTIIAINPAKQLSDAQDATRKNTVRQMENAVYQRLIDEWEAIDTIPIGEGNAKQICQQGVTDDPTCVNLDMLVPEYIAAIPVDPTEETHTGYTIYQDSSGRSHVTALHEGTAGGSQSSVSSSSSTSSEQSCTPGGDPMVICDCTGLQNMQADLTADYILGQDIDCSDTVNWDIDACDTYATMATCNAEETGCYWKVGWCVGEEMPGCSFDEISCLEWCGGTSWVDSVCEDNKGFDPVGNERGTSMFTGTLDGNGYVISNLYMNRYSPIQYFGMFGVTGSEANIHDVGMENVDITATDVTGPLVGYNTGNVSNAYTTGIVNGKTWVGGLVGENRDGGTIANSYSMCTIIASSGLIGGLSGTNGGTINNAFAAGDVTGESSVGGLVGFNMLNINNSFATGDVAGIDSGGWSLGSVVGNMVSGTITNIYWNNHSGNPDSCYSGGNVGCTVISDNQSYFYSAENAPMDTWNFVDVWQENPGSLPTLR
ncbi:MAG: type II secretion system protein [Candidatus Peribacteraceae bacterium]|jgi:prepilin-type N-terminal cleavage/methylation domain-containing protein